MGKPSPEREVARYTLSELYYWEGRRDEMRRLIEWAWRNTSDPVADLARGELKFQITETKLLSPEWAMLRTTSTGTVKILANGAEVPGNNQELFLLRKTNGQWKIARYAFNSVLRPVK